MSDTKPDIVIPGESAELLGQIFAANASWSEQIQNRVEESYQREATEWKKAFLELYDTLEGVNLIVDSKKLDNVLYRFGQKAHFASQPGWWEKVDR